MVVMVKMPVPLAMRKFVEQKSIDALVDTLVEPPVTQTLEAKVQHTRWPKSCAAEVP